MFNFLRRKVEVRKESRFVWKDRHITITPDVDFDPDTSLSLSGQEKQELREELENKFN